MKKTELTLEQIEICEQGFSQACDNDFITPNSSRKEIDDNIYEILEFACDDVDAAFSDEALDAAVDYIFDNCCN
jgi:hypothetical protein